MDNDRAQVITTDGGGKLKWEVDRNARPLERLRDRDVPGSSEGRAGNRGLIINDMSPGYTPDPLLLPSNYSLGKEVHWRNRTRDVVNMGQQAQEKEEIR